MGGDIGGAIQGGIDSVRNSSPVQNISSAVSSAWDTTKNVANHMWDNPRDAFLNPWGTAMEAVDPRLGMFNVLNPVAYATGQAQDVLAGGKKPAAQQSGSSMAPNPYPAFSNDFGLGAPITPVAQPTPGAQSNPGYLDQPINVNVPDSSGRGFNPWSLQGESNARG